MTEYMIKWYGDSVRSKTCTSDEYRNFPNLEWAIKYAIQSSFVKKSFPEGWVPRPHNIIPLGFSIFQLNPKKKVVHYSRARGNPDKVTVVGMKSVSIPYGTAFKIGISYFDKDHVKNPTLSRETYHSIKEARAAARQLIQKTKAKYKVENVTVEVVSLKMFGGKNVYVGAVEFSDITPEYIWLTPFPFETGRACVVTPKGNLGEEIVVY